MFLKRTIKETCSNGPSRRILVIDDDFDSAEVLQTFLELNGHKASVTTCAETGLRTAKEISPEIVICDLRLSGNLSGLDVAHTLRGKSEGDGCYLIALSGHGQPEDRARSAAAGFDVHLTKPADFDALLRVINGVAIA